MDKEAFLNGWHANRLGIDVEKNPYDETTQSVSHSQWCSGWCARFSALKHGLSLEFDDYDT